MIILKQVKSEMELILILKQMKIINSAKALYDLEQIESCPNASFLIYSRKTPPIKEKCCLFITRGTFHLFDFEQMPSVKTTAI